MSASRDHLSHLSKNEPGPTPEPWQPNPLWRQTFRNLLFEAYELDNNSIKGFLAGLPFSIAQLWQTGALPHKSKQPEYLRPLPPDGESAELPYSTLPKNFIASWTKLRRSWPYRLEAAFWTLRSTSSLKQASKSYRAEPPAPRVGWLKSEESLLNFTSSHRPPDKELSVLAPSWMEQMFNQEGYSQLEAGQSQRQLVCVGGGPVPLSPSELDSVDLVWILTPDLTQTDREWIAKAKAVIELPPAVHPSFHNPIGWWNREPGVLLNAESREETIPTSWRSVFQAARGQCASRKPTLAEDLARYSLSAQTLKNSSLQARLNEIRRTVGLEPRLKKPPVVSVLVCTKRPNFLRSTLTQLISQTYPHRELVLVLHSDRFEDVVIEECKKLLQTTDMPYTVLEVSPKMSFGQALQLGTEACRGDYIAKWDDDDHYAKGYLDDLVMTAEYADAGIVGKRGCLVEFVGNPDFIYVNRRQTFRYWPEPVAGGTMLIRREVFSHLQWRPESRHLDDYLCQDCIDLGFPILRTNPYFFRMKRWDSHDHTWLVRHSEILAQDGQIVSAEQAAREFLNG